MNDEDTLEIEIPYDSWQRFRLKEVFIKKSGETWIFHKNDPDPSPSQPHGHNKETGEKLDIFTGNCYNPRNGVMERKLNKNTLIGIQNELKQKGFL